LKLLPHRGRRIRAGLDTTRWQWPLAGGCGACRRGNGNDNGDDDLQSTIHPDLQKRNAHWPEVLHIEKPLPAHEPSRVIELLRQMLTCRSELPSAVSARGETSPYTVIDLAAWVRIVRTERERSVTMRRTLDEREWVRSTRQDLQTP